MWRTFHPGHQCPEKGIRLLILEEEEGNDNEKEVELNRT